jgi:hypothetical protein
MKTLDVAHAKILARLAELRPDSARQWGKMSCHQMIVHLSDSFQVPLGERQAGQASVPVPRGIFKWFALYFPVKWPHGVKTMPEMEQGVGGTAPVEFLAALGLPALRPSSAAVWGVRAMERASNDEISKIPELVHELVTNVLDDGEEPFFISDEATIYDVSMASPEDLRQRCSDYYGRPVSLEELRMPLWQLLRQLRD